MKKLTTAILAASLTLTAYADTTAPAANNAQPAAAQQPAATQPAAPAKPAEKPKQSQNSSSDTATSVYESVRSGWNSFIDVLTGTKDPGK